MKTEIRVGQTWRENLPPHRELRITSVDGDDCAAVFTRRDSGEVVFLAAWLTGGWCLVEPAPPRRISLTLAADTTATECGACPLLQTHDERVGSVTSCGRWGGDMGRSRMRLPECIAAEVPNG
jgi:hypothetical protein